MNSNAFGHLFTGFFGLWFLFILSLFACTGIQQALRSGAPDRRHAHGELPACDVAYLSGGPQRALLSALTALKLAGLVQVDGRTVRAIGRVRPGLDELQRAVLEATTAPVPRSQLASRPGVATALAGIEKRLVERGLLLSDRRRRLGRLAGIIPLVVAVALLVTTVQGVVQTGSAFHVLFGLGAVVVVLLQFRRTPRRTRPGDRTLGELRQRHRAPGARLGSGRSADDDATGAALSVGIYGNEAVRSCDPGLADALCLPHTGDGGGMFGGGDSWGSGGGSDSGGGWHSGSSWDPGSSWDSGSSWSSGGSDGGSSSSSDSSSSS